MTSLHTKREQGRYYTEGNPFLLKPFTRWAEKIDLKQHAVLEPFAGANNIITALQVQGYAQRYTSFDIAPACDDVTKQDTIQTFPTTFKVAITNPPWLAKNSAHRRGLSFPNTTHDDLYKHCLDLMLTHCQFIGALVPATFLQSNLFRKRLDSFIVLHNKQMFFDTENPVGLALFSDRATRTKIYYDNAFVGYLASLEQHLPKPIKTAEVRFNEPKGNLGFIAFDNTKQRSIRFVNGEEINEHRIKHTTRMITRIRVDMKDHSTNELIQQLNNDIDTLRTNTNDVFLTPFKGLRQDGHYRRRMEYSLAKQLILQYA